VPNNFFCKTQHLNVLEKPNSNSNISSEIIYGEKFNLLSKTKNFYKIKNQYDNYIGYVKISKLNNNLNPTHKIKVLKSKIYRGIFKKKIATKKFLSFGSRIEILKEEKKFIMFEKNKWIKSSEICQIKEKNRNFSRIFKLFLNCPYKWGGKTFKGIDCSALIQVYYKYNNKYFPRDTVDQIKIKKGFKNKKNYRKGDIIYWKGHVAVCLNSKFLIHAYGPKKKVVIMPIYKTIDLINKTANLKVKKIFKI
tara:strand:+ start:1379 stop:2128 length:750 start_codon:yes stop_codon:yes gene_type:complete